MSSYALSEPEFNHLITLASDRYDSSISYYILRRLLAVVDNTLEHYNLVFAIRVDLRFAQDHIPDAPDMPVCFQRTDERAITRFIESLKSQLKAAHHSSGRSGTPTLPYYVWVRERNESEYAHYHLVLLFNADVYNYLGNYLQDDANNMATRIQRAWCSAIGLVYPDYAPLVNFPENPVFRFDRRDALTSNSNYLDFLLRIAYLAKMNTKELITDFRNFGTSQI
ncbi:inovirus Gp2 family protein [Providencia vermicola]|uniref:inovirus Gp2 family protein n=1 Tax=Providencia vermicola TaxID=333965 RepID=UPI001CED9EDE|nr:inovirus Gp2 family protein [Providencia vermicola]